MKIKPDPVKYLHQRRKRELRFIFKRFPSRIFEKGLEVGGGDGYQSTILQNYVNELICTEYVKDRLPKEDLVAVKYICCDAEKISSYFDKEEFDLIFSSNMIEHLRKPTSFLKGSYFILKDEGLMVHSIPNRFWKFSQMVLHHFNYLILFLEYLSLSRKIVLNEKKESYDNPKSEKRRIKKKNLLQKIMWPSPHGVSKTNIQEFLDFGKKNRIKLFEANGFKIVKIIKGPVSSGYNLGMKKMVRFMERLGFSSSYIYVTIKKGKNTNFLKYKEYLKYLK